MDEVDLSTAGWERGGGSRYVTCQNEGGSDTRTVLACARLWPIRLPPAQYPPPSCPFSTPICYHCLPSPPARSTCDNYSLLRRRSWAGMSSLVVEVGTGSATRRTHDPEIGATLCFKSKNLLDKKTWRLRAINLKAFGAL